MIYLRIFLTMTLGFAFSLSLQSCVFGGEDVAQNPIKTEKKQTLGLGLPHPRAPDAWETNVILVSNIIPDSQELHDCHKESKELSKDSINKISLLQAQTAMSEMVSQRPKVYHWCFYYVARHLDRKMDEVGIVWAEKNTTFLTFMREMWVMARSLEEKTQDKRYYKYLHHRYVQISRDVFGRNLEIVSPPIDYPPEKPPALKAPGEEATEEDVDT
ncbi:MAG: hypothetical protein AB8C84_01810 [Oligoflexales bacterium]